MFNWLQNTESAGVYETLFLGAQRKLSRVHASVATNNSLFEYSNNRRPNNDIRIRIRSFLKYWIIFEYSNNKLRITNNQVQYFNFEFNPFLYGNWMKNWVNVCRYQFISNSHIVIQEILFLMVRESWDIWVLRF